MAVAAPLTTAMPPIDNNVIKRDIWPFTTFRKNWLFSSTVAGAQRECRDLQHHAALSRVRRRAVICYAATARPARHDSKHAGLARCRETSAYAATVESCLMRSLNTPMLASSLRKLCMNAGKEAWTASLSAAAVLTMFAALPR